jgi:hypothetical protein
MATRTLPLPVNVAKGPWLIANCVVNDSPVNLVVDRDSTKWTRYIEPALERIYAQSSESIECPDCKRKLRRGTSLASHLRSCPHGPRLLRRRKAEKVQ